MTLHEIYRYLNPLMLVFIGALTIVLIRLVNNAFISAITAKKESPTSDNEERNVENRGSYDDNSPKQLVLLIDEMKKQNGYLKYQNDLLRARYLVMEHRVKNAQVKKRAVFYGGGKLGIDIQIESESPEMYYWRKHEEPQKNIIHNLNPKYALK